MKILVTGVNGQLGRDVVEELKQRGIDTVAPVRQQMDITDAQQVENFLRQEKPDTVIHCAAYTAVDKAEDDRENCADVNVNGTQYLAKACKELGCKMMYISTDYVFDGTGERPWEPEDVVTQPLNYYGETKYEGELKIRQYLDQYFIVRISWVFGENGGNFIKTMLRLGKERGKVSVVDDQIGSPTYTKDLAALLADMIGTEEYGIYHATNEGLCSWYEFAQEIFAAAGMQVQVTPVKSTEFPTRAKRPFNSRMSKDKLEKHGFKKLPSWQNATDRYVKSLLH